MSEIDVFEEARLLNEKFRAQEAARDARSAPKRDYYRPPRGTANIRILPKANAHSWFVHTATHWIDKQPFLCTEKTHGISTPCPICAHQKTLYQNAGNDASLLKEAKDLYPNVKYTVHVVEMKDPVYTQAHINDLKAKYQDHSNLPNVGDTRILIWQMNQKIMSSLSSVLAQGADFTSLEQGNEITLTTKPGNNPQFLETTTMILPMPRKFELRGEIPDLSSILVLPSAERYAKVLPSYTAPALEAEYGQTDHFQEDDLPESYSQPSAVAAARQGAVDLSSSLGAQVAARKAAR